MTLSPSLLIPLITCLFFSSLISADELYVLKNVKVHTEASLESPVTKLLLGGEKVNVLSIDSNFTEVEDDDENTGWVSSDFLTDVEPIRITPKKEVERVAEDKPQNMSKKKTQVQKKITKKVNNKGNSVTASDKKGSKANLSTLSSTTSSNPSSKNSQQALLLQKENQQLKAQLEKIHFIINDTLSTNKGDYDSVDKSETTLINSFNFDTSSLSLWFALGGLIIGFIIGLLWSDFRQRRHHGGFKV